MSVRFVTSGGHWDDHGALGHYRLVVMRGRFEIDWIEESAGGERLRESRHAAVLGEPWVLDQPALAADRQTGGRADGAAWRATVTGTDPATGRHVRWLITLGPPGRYGISPAR